MKKTSRLDLEIRRRINAVLQDISDLVKSSALEAVKGVLGESATPAPAASRASRPGPARAPARRGRRGKRTSAEVDAFAAEILSHVRSNAGQRLEQIAKSMGRASKEMKLPIQKLLAARAVRTEGQKRGTKYFAGGGSRRGARKGRSRKG